jgi:hypothetical protein
LGTWKVKSQVKQTLNVKIPVMTKTVYSALADHIGHIGLPHIDGKIV